MAISDDVTQLYQQQFGRAPDADGAAYFSNFLSSGGSAQQAAALMQASPEAQARAAPGIVGGGGAAAAPAASTTNWYDGINAQYQKVLGRDIDDAGKATWRGLDANTQQTDAELQAQLNEGFLKELAGRNPKSTTTSGGIINGAAQMGDPTAWTVTPEQTVEGRIQGIINGAIGQKARARATGEMNERGLASSSMATTASDAAAYDAAIPIATADASTFSKAAGYNADQTNQFAVKNTDYQNQFLLQGQQIEAQKYIAQLQEKTQREIASMNIDAQKLANKVQIDNQTLLQTNSNAASAFNTAASAINNIANNSQMDADTKTRATADVWNNLQTQLKVLGSVAGLDLTKTLNFAGYPGFDAQGKFVGFEDGPGSVTKGAAPAATPTPTPAPFSDSGGGGAA